MSAMGLLHPITLCKHVQLLSLETDTKRQHAHQSVGNDFLTTVRMLFIADFCFWEQIPSVVKIFSAQGWLVSGVMIFLLENISQSNVFDYCLVLSVKMANKFCCTISRYWNCICISCPLESKQILTLIYFVGFRGNVCWSKRAIHYRDGY